MNAISLSNNLLTILMPSFHRSPPASLVLLLLEASDFALRGAGLIPVAPPTLSDPAKSTTLRIEFWRSPPMTMRSSSILRTECDREEVLFIFVAATLLWRSPRASSSSASSMLLHCTVVRPCTLTCPRRSFTIVSLGGALT